MKYRILQEDELYYVQYRRRWWPFWSTYKWYKSYDEPVEVTGYGGFFMNIGFQTKSYGDYYSWEYSLHDAEARLSSLKEFHCSEIKRKANDKLSIRKVIHRS